MRHFWSRIDYVNDPQSEIELPSDPTQRDSRDALRPCDLAIESDAPTRSRTHPSAARPTAKGTGSHLPIQTFNPEMNPVPFIFSPKKPPAPNIFPPGRKNVEITTEVAR
jgi:hypothetical protein